MHTFMFWAVIGLAIVVFGDKLKAASASRDARRDRAEWATIEARSRVKGRR